jgi:hypothetical protein
MNIRETIVYFGSKGTMRKKKRGGTDLQFAERERERERERETERNKQVL